jgi:hypothetical protein
MQSFSRSSASVPRELGSNGVVDLNGVSYNEQARMDRAFGGIPEASFNGWPFGPSLPVSASGKWGQRLQMEPSPPPSPGNRGQR